ncbi:Uncharacterised protein [Vibrio cholerae]|nr:Uncharacterised protein [Vibrio cholerae]CSH93263.1 Uncharacterised protein [Vibrio cholerae]
MQFNFQPKAHPRFFVHLIIEFDQAIATALFSLIHRGIGILQ